MAREYGTDEGKYYGGSAVDNQAFFDADGNALHSLYAFDYDKLKNGMGDSEKRVDHYKELTYTMQTGQTFTASDLPKGLAYYNTADRVDFDIDWDGDDIAEINQKAARDTGVGTYEVRGTAELDGETIEQICTVYVIIRSILENGDFENYGTNSWTGWEVAEGSVGCNTNDMSSNSRSGTGSIHFWKADEFSFSVYQNVDLTDIVPGEYRAVVYAEGADARAELRVTVGDEGYSSSATALGGWGTWLEYAIDEIDLSMETIDGLEDKTAKFEIVVNGDGGGYGGVDDAYFNLVSIDLQYLAKLAKEVDQLIDAIGTVDIDKWSQIEAARSAYEALPEGAKELVTELSVLEAAEVAYAELEKSADETQKAAIVDEKIAAIGAVTIDSGSIIKEARSAYDALSETAKTMVTRLAELTEAEKAYASLVTEENEKKAAAAVDEKIKAIGKVTAESGDLIKAARAVYDALSSTAKSRVTLLTVLTAAEKEYDAPIAEQTAPDAASVTLSKAYLTLEIGKTEALVANVLPENAKDKSVKYTTSDDSVVTVSADGVVSAVSLGTAVVTATTAVGGHTAECGVLVVSEGVSELVGDTSVVSEGDTIVAPTQQETPKETVSVKYKGETIDINVTTVWQNAVNYTGKTIKPDETMAARVDTASIENSLTLNAKALQDGKTASDLIKTSFVSKKKNAGEATFYAKISITKAAKKYLSKSEYKKLAAEVKAANSQLKKNVCTYTINKRSVTYGTLKIKVQKSKGAVKLKKGKIAKVKKVQLVTKDEAGNEITITVPAKNYDIELIDAATGLVKITGKKNFTGTTPVYVE